MRGSTAGTLDLSRSRPSTLLSRLSFCSIPTSVELLTQGGHAADGRFLVRERPGNPGDLVLSLNFKVSNGQVDKRISADTEQERVPRA